MLNLVFALLALIVNMVTFIEIEYHPQPVSPPAVSAPVCPGGVCPVR